MIATFEKAVDIIDNMSDELIEQLYEESTQSTFAEDSLMRKVVVEVYGKVDIMHIQVIGILPALLKVVMDRFRSYSKYMIPR